MTGWLRRWLLGPSLHLEERHVALHRRHKRTTELVADCIERIEVLEDKMGIERPKPQWREGVVFPHLFGPNVVVPPPPKVVTRLVPTVTREWPADEEPPASLEVEKDEPIHECDDCPGGDCQDCGAWFIPSPSRECQNEPPETEEHVRHPDHSRQPEDMDLYKDRGD